LIQKVGYRLRFLWKAFAEWLGRFLDEAAFRILICWRVTTGQLPQSTRLRAWNRQREVPVSVNFYEWTSGVLVATILIWPPLEAPAHTMEQAEHYQQQRAEWVMQAITRGASEMSWSFFYEIEERLQWDQRREAWITSDGHAYEYPGDV
jgi:hypothetical protein